MYIQPINFTQKQNISNPNFRLNTRVVKNNLGKVQYRTTTYFMRGDLHWEKAAEYFRNLAINPLKNTEKINVYDFGCSSGEETLSIILSFIKYMKPEQYEKFFPIIARDLDEKNIINAKNGMFVASNIEKVCLERLITDNSQCKFLDAKPNNPLLLGDAKYQVEFNPNILCKADFSTGNIITDIDSLPKKPSILYCRNMWAYIPRVDQISLLKKISGKFKGTNSHIIFGDYDNAYGTNHEFTLYCSPTGSFNDNGTVVHLGIQQNGYEPTKVHNVFRI